MKTTVKWRVIKEWPFLRKITTSVSEEADIKASGEWLHISDYPKKIKYSDGLVLCPGSFKK